MRRTALMFVLVCFAVTAAPVVAQTDAEVAKEIIALAKAQWAAEIAEKPLSEAMASIAEEYTEFNPDTPVRLDGKAINMKFAEAARSDSADFIAADMANEKVQVYGDVAILSYNFVGMSKDKDGKTEPILAKSTRVYAKKGGKWMLVHANFGPVN